jgi:hypothetical protein
MRTVRKARSKLQAMSTGRVPLLLHKPCLQASSNNANVRKGHCATRDELPSHHSVYLKFTCHHPSLQCAGEARENLTHIACRHNLVKVHGAQVSETANTMLRIVCVRSKGADADAHLETCGQLRAPSGRADMSLSDGLTPEQPLEQE